MPPSGYWAYATDEKGKLVVPYICKFWPTDEQQTPEEHGSRETPADDTVLTEAARAAAVKAARASYAAQVAKVAATKAQASILQAAAQGGERGISAGETAAGGVPQHVLPTTRTSTGSTEQQLAPAVPYRTSQTRLHPMRLHGGLQRVS